MKRSLYCGGLCIALLAYWSVASAQGPDIGPGDGGAALRNPFDPAPTRGAPTRPAPSAPVSDVERAFYGKSGSTTPDTASVAPDGKLHGLAALKPSAKDDINKDIAVQASHGPWMISVMSYTGPESPKMAREFVNELRTTYKLPAFVFNYGSEERKKEYDRVKAIVDKQKKFCEDNNLPLEKVRIRYTMVPDQCAVLVGGFATEDAGQRELKKMRSLPAPDEKKVKLDIGFFARGEREASKFEFKHDPKSDEQVAVYVNPFKRAFLARNPTMKVERKEDELDMGLVRKLNTGEPFNLLECKKPFTLAIAQFRTPAGSEEAISSPSVLGALGLAKKKQREDYAAANANILADNLRKHFKLEAYVLHTRFSSVVSVGAYDSAEDPGMRTMKNLLAERLRIPSIDLFPEPMLMKVPQ